MDQPLTDSDIISLLGPDIDTAKAYQRELSEERERYFRIYRAMPYGNEVDGWSKTVHPTVFSAVEWTKPGLYEIFTGDFFNFTPIRKDPPPQPPVPGFGAGIPPGMPPAGMGSTPPGMSPQMVGPGPGRPGRAKDPQDESAKRLKDYIRFKLFNQLDGEQIIDDGIHDALTTHYAVAKVTHRDDYDLDVEPVARISTQDLTVLSADPSFVDILGGQSVQEVDPATGAIVWDGVEGASIVRKKTTYNGFYLEIVPASEFYFLPGYPDIQKNPLVAHVVRRDLDYVRRQEMAGVYRQGSVDRLKDKVSSRDEPSETAEERQAYAEADGLNRATEYGETTSSRPERLPANEVLIWECYCRLDIRGDGLLRPCIVTICEDVVLREPIENPYGGPPFELGYIFKEPNKAIGRPLPAMLEQQQKVLTNLLRSMQDSAARSTYAGWLTSDPKAHSMLRDFAPGHVGYVPDVSKVQELKTSAPSQFIFNAFQLSLQEVSKESGINENQMGLDNNSLNKTAAGMNMRLTASMQRQKLYAHRMARWWKRILRRILDIIRLFPPQDDVGSVGSEIMIREEDLAGQFSVDIEVGVGPQDRQAQATLMSQYVQMLAQVMIPQGMAQPAHFLKAVDAMYEYQDMDVSAYHFDEQEVDAWGKIQQQMQQMDMALQQAQGENAGLKKAIDDHAQSLQQQNAQQQANDGGQQGFPQGMAQPQMQQQMPTGGAPILGRG